jgi:hypothetical protein
MIYMYIWSHTLCMACVWVHITRTPVHPTTRHPSATESEHISFSSSFCFPVRIYRSYHCHPSFYSKFTNYPLPHKKETPSCSSSLFLLAPAPFPPLRPIRRRRRDADRLATQSPRCVFLRLPHLPLIRWTLPRSLPRFVPGSRILIPSPVFSLCWSSCCTVIFRRIGVQIDAGRCSNPRRRPPGR